MVIPIKILGDALSVLLLTFIIVLIDTLTKWIAVSIRFCKDKEYKPSILNVFRGIFFRAWQEGYLESQKYKWAILIKGLAYLLTIALAVIIYMLLPEYKFNGIYVGETIAILIYVFIVMAEAFSIAENIKEAGYQHAEILERALEASLSKVGIQYRHEENINSYPDLPREVMKGESKEHNENN